MCELRTGCCVDGIVRIDRFDAKVTHRCSLCGSLWKCVNGASNPFKYVRPTWRLVSASPRLDPVTSPLVEAPEIADSESSVAIVGE